VCNRTIGLGLAVGLALLASAAAANAEVRVSGTADDIIVHATGATLVDVLAGLEPASHAGIELRGATSRRFTGTYSGPLRVVLSRLLNGVDHVIHIAPDRITIVIVGPGAPGAGARMTVATVRDGDGGSGVQGWMPSGPVPGVSSAAVAQTHSAPPAAAADEAEATSGVQGWVPSGPQVASIAAATYAQAAPSDASANAAPEEKAASVQGWVPAQIAAPTQPAPAGGAPQPPPVASDDGTAGRVNGGVQGWVPTAARAY
jgi:hypothetical protein